MSDTYAATVTVTNNHGQHSRLTSKAGKISVDSAPADGLALAGSGVALAKPQWLVNTALEDGTLIHLLPDYHFPRQGIYAAVYPDARHVMTKVRTFIDFCPQWDCVSTPHH